MKKVYIAEGIRPTLFPDNALDIEKNILGNNFQIKLLNKGKEADILEDIGDADAMIVRPGIDITLKTINNLSKCKIIVNLAVGVDNIDLNFASNKGILVCNIPDYGTEEVADTSIGLILSLTRKISLYNNQIKNHKNWNWRSGIPQYRIRGKTIGIIGLGRIGIAVAERAKSFGLNIVYFDPYRSVGMSKSLGIIECDRIEDLTKISDIITIHTPLNKETNGIINMGFLKMVKKGAIFINTARGKLFDNLDTIYYALKNDIFSAVGTDVLPFEPPDYNHKLLKAWRDNESWIKDRLIITPHTAFYCKEGIDELRMKGALTIRKFFNGDILNNCVNGEL